MRKYSYSGPHVVMTRSVLIYVADKARAFAEFRRILRPGGRLSIWEPINVHGFPEPAGRLAGYDVGPLAAHAARVRDVFDRRQPRATSPMLDFDERDPGMLEMLRLAVAGARRNHRHVGICGEAPANYPEIARFLTEIGVDSISVNPASLMRTIAIVAGAEASLTLGGAIVAATS